jgi:hypothetical protein
MTQQQDADIYTWADGVSLSETSLPWKVMQGKRVSMAVGLDRLPAVREALRQQGWAVLSQESRGEQGPCLLQARRS